MKIRLQRAYRGAPSQEQLILEGEYTTGDEALYGVDPAYLVEIGFAVEIKSGASQDDSASDTSKSSSKSTKGKG